MAQPFALKRRRDTAYDWELQNTTLLEGQLGFQSDEGEGGRPLVKWSPDGTTPWNDLPFMWRKNNLEATTDPTTSNDDSEYYEVGSLWSNVNDPDNPRVFILTDLSSGANWQQINGGGAGSQTLAQTLVLGNTTGGEDIDFSAGDKLSFVLANNFQEIIDLPNSTGIEHLSGGALEWNHKDITFTDSSSSQTFKLNDSGRVDVGSDDVDGSARIYDASNNSYFLLDTPNITANRTLTFPDGDLDFTAGASEDNYVLTWNDSLKQWTAEAIPTQGGEDLNETLYIGNTTGGIDIEVSSGDAIVFDDTSGQTEIFPTTLTANRAITLPDADIDFTGALDNYFLQYNASTETWEPAAGGAGGESLAQTLGIGNTTGADATTSGNDIVVSRGDVIDFTNALPTNELITFPNSEKLIWLNQPMWDVARMTWRDTSGTQYFDVRDTGLVTIGNIGIDANLRLVRDGSDIDIISDTLTANRTVTLPDGDVDFTAGASEDGYVLKYDDSTETWSAEPESGGGGGDISGPSTSTDNAIVRWDGTGGDTIQDSSVLIDDSDNVSGANRVETKVINQATINTLSATSGFDWDLDDGNFAQLTLTSDETLNAPTNLRVSTYLLLVKQDGTGGHSLSYDSSYQFPLGTPVLDDAANGETWISFVCDGTTVTGVGITGESTNQLITLTDTSGLDVDLSLSDYFEYTLTSNETLNFPTNLRVTNFQIKFVQDGTGSRTLSFDSSYKFSGGTAPTLTTDPNAEDIITAFCDGTNVYIVSSLDFQTA
jgi:hypothetical protein